MKHYIARYYRDKNGTLQDVDIDWSHRKPIEIDRGIVRGIDMCNVVYRGSRDLHDELFDLCNDSVRSYISQNSRMTDAVPCEIRLVSYKAISDSSEYEWHFNITLCTDDKDWAQTVKSELNRKYGLLSALQIQRIIVNNLATIVFWEDGTKTVVKISDSDMEDGKYDIYAGVSYAIAKKLFGSNSAFKREVDRKMENKTPVHVSKYFSQEQLKEMAKISTKLLKHFIGEKNHE